MTQKETEQSKKTFQKRLNEVKTFINNLNIFSNTTKTPITKPKPKYKISKNLKKSKSFPVDTKYVSPRFDVDDPKAMEYLKDNGYVIIKNVLSHDECVNLRSKTWDWIGNNFIQNQFKKKCFSSKTLKISVFC